MVEAQSILSPPNSKDSNAEDLYEDEIKSIKYQYRQWSKDPTKVTNSDYIKLKPTDNLFVWNVILRAKPKDQELWGENWYRAQLVFFKDFPLQKPELRFSERFNNLFVSNTYPHNLCYSALNEWKETDSLVNVLPGIIDILFANPDLEYSENRHPVLSKKAAGAGNGPLNIKLARTYIDSRREYQEIIKGQALTQSYTSDNLDFKAL